MSDPSTLVYLIYGIPGSGRREVLFDLLSDGIEHNEPVLYFHPEGEVASSFDQRLQALRHVSMLNWKLDGAKVIHGTIQAAPNKIIFLAPGRSDPANVAEAIQAWMNHHHCRLARILTVVDCSFLSTHHEAQPWFDACIHFSDIVLLNRREGVANKWVKDFEAGYRTQCCPTRFLLVKKGRVANPFEVLEPEARRLSLYFDEHIPIEADEFEEDALAEEIKPDPYIERLESGHRVYPVPDIGTWL